MKQTIILYMVDVVQSVKSLFFQLKVSCVRSTTTVSQSRLSSSASQVTLLKRKNLARLQVKRIVLATNETIDWDKKVAPSAIYEEGAVVFPVLHGPMGRRWLSSRILGSFENALCWL